MKNAAFITMLKVLRRGSARFLAVTAILLTVLVCLYYVNYTSNTLSGVTMSTHDVQVQNAKYEAPRKVHHAILELADEGQSRRDTEVIEMNGNDIVVDGGDEWMESDSAISRDTCAAIVQPDTDVDTVEQFKKFEFQPYWMKSREYWDTSFEERYKTRKTKWAELPLKVILIPHSHNDPGWLKTYESYFHYQTRNILNNMVDKLHKFKNMTFIWSEVSFFAHWWESAHPFKKRVVKELLAEGRLEMTTGGWVMTDEATTHIYGMLDQLIEGHQWLKNNLGISPKSGWSIDPFGHGSTVPYLLKASGFTGGTVIQRVHYAWKQWLAEQQMGDFHWRQNWDTDGHTDILTHNQPFDIYSIKHSCGPHPEVCLNFDFRKIRGEYTEYSVKAVAIEEHNIKQKAELLLEQYGRTGSLFPHNVVMMPIGDDFRYDHDIEWDQQYRNYKLLADFINQNKKTYNAEIVFGTPSTYFEAIKERTKHFQTLRGDFFVYSDIFSEGRPAYWSGYFTTRPYWKLLDRELEANLRSAEILYTVALNRARQSGFNKTIQLLERDYEKLTKARQSLALFQHHDAITGTSKAFVMHDYALKMFEGIQDTTYIQGRCAQMLLLKDMKDIASNPDKNKPLPFNFLLPDTDRESYEKLAKKVPLVVPRNEPRHIVLFNSLAQQRQDVVKVRVTSPNVRVLDADGNPIPYQVNPVWNLTQLNKPTNREQESGDQSKLVTSLQMSRDHFEVMFVADLPPLTIATYTIERVAEKNIESRAIVYCVSCGKNVDDSNYVPPFEVKGMQAGDIQLENHRMKLLFDGRSGFLKALTRKASGRTTQCGLQFAAYPSAQFHSGAYLFMPDPNSREPERDILNEDQLHSNLQIVITSGPIASEMTVIYHPILAHSVRIYHAAGPLSEGIYIENVIDFEAPPKNRETELFMRVVTDISNGDPPEFYSDLNGFQMQKRVKVERIGIEGNYFPITSMAYIQDSSRRLSLLVNHAQGAASWQPGWLEVMLDRRTLYDDSRGMGEGVVDNKRTLTKFWLLLEDVATDDAKSFSRPSLFAHHLSNNLLYPSNLFVIEGVTQATQEETHQKQLSLHKKVSIINKPFPCDVHLMNFRTASDPTYMQFPATSALLVLHRFGYACDVGKATVVPQCALAKVARDKALVFHKDTKFRDLALYNIVQTTLTGLHKVKEHKNFDQIQIKPMELSTLNITFVL